MGGSQEAPKRVPPQNSEAERQLLGAILIKDPAIDSVLPIIKADDFYEPRNSVIFTAMLELKNKGMAIDQITMLDHLSGSGKLEEAGGAVYISDLANYMPTAAHAEDYAKIIREKSDLRKLINISSDVITKAFEEDTSSLDLVQDAESRIFDITERNKGEMINIKEMAHQVYEQIDRMSKRSDELIGLPTGYKYIDQATQGLRDGELIIVAARPSVGKTALVLNIAHHVATTKNKSVLIFSFEMGSEELIRRMIAVGSGVSLTKISTGKLLTKPDREKIMHTLGKLSDQDIYIDTADNDVFQMRAKARTIMSKIRRENKDKKLDLIIVDYMQLVKPTKEPSREQQIAAISRGLKALARDAKVPVIALSQLNRESEKRDRTTKAGAKIPPKLSDLRESGSIEQDADVVLFIDREDEKDLDGQVTEGGESRAVKIRNVKLIIAKNRNGPLADQSVMFLPELTAFREKSGRDTDEAFS